MHSLLRPAAIALLLLPLGVATASAQNYRGAFGLYGGGIWFSDFNNGGPETAPGTTFQGQPIGNTELALGQGWIAGTQLEVWLGRGRLGLRLNGGFTERSLDMEFQENVPGFNADDDMIFTDINTWFADGDLMIRLATPRRDRMWAPFVSLGLGLVRYDPPSDTDIVLTQSNARLPNPDNTLVGAFGIGTDILGKAWGLRLEIADHLAFNSWAEPLTEPENDYSPVHHVRFSAGVHKLFGKLFPEEIVAVAPPAPPPPAPPPAPVEETITICVIDPGTTGAIRTVNAVFVPSTGDTLFVRSGQRVAFSTAFPANEPVYVRTANWYVTGQPLTFTVVDDDASFVTFGGSRIISSTDLVFLGTVDGVPVFADASEVTTIRTRIVDVHTTTTNLETILMDNEDIRTTINEVDVLYVPLATGCVFQPLQRMEEVRKVRG